MSGAALPTFQLRIISTSTCIILAEFPQYLTTIFSYPKQHRRIYKPESDYLAARLRKALSQKFLDRVVLNTELFISNIHFEHTPDTHAGLAIIRIYHSCFILYLSADTLLAHACIYQYQSTHFLLLVLTNSQWFCPISSSILCINSAMQTTQKTSYRILMQERLISKNKKTATRS